jgi:hypothetical protein
VGPARRFKLEPLEDRVLLSADLLGLADWQDDSDSASLEPVDAPVLFELESEAV